MCTPTPRMVTGNSMGVGKSKEEDEAKVEFPKKWRWVGRGGSHQKTICGGGWDIFWSHTLRKDARSA